MTDIYLINSGLQLLLPIALAISFFRRNAEHARIANSLHAEFARTLPTVDTVRDILRTTLNDPTLDLNYTPDEKHPFTGSQPPQRLVKALLDHDGNSIAFINGDIELSRHPAVLETALNACAIALENARLHETVQSQLAEVELSRTRIAEAALEERRRIERDLHDGVQQRLLALSTRIGAATQQVDGEMHETLSALNNDLTATLTAVRELAQGIHPTELRQFGLPTVVADISQHLPVTVEADILTDRLPPRIELTAYFVICEALTNIVKHAFATHATVSVQKNGADIDIEISDNGRGAQSLDGGSGIVGLRDRVSALGGSLSTTTSDTGTSIMATLPCK